MTDQEALDRWFTLNRMIADNRANMKPYIDEELVLRRKVFGLLFPAGHEGVNTFRFPGTNMVVKGTKKLSRTVDEAAIGPLLEAYPHLASVVQFKPSLLLANYRKLTDENQNLLKPALIVRDTTPELIVNEVDDA